MPVLVGLGLLFVIVPIVEIALIIAVGQAIGLWPTLALLILDSLVGTWLMRSQGRAAWQRFQGAIAGGRPPAGEAVDGALVIFGGACLLTPGFATDVFGIALLLPPSRALIRRLILPRVILRMASSVARGPGPFAPPPRAPGTQYDVDGTAQDIDPDPRRLP